MGTPISLSFAMLSLAVGGMAMLPFVMPNIAMSLVIVPVNLVTITLMSPGRDPLHYPRRVIAWLRSQRGRRDEARAELARANDPVNLAWDMLTCPPHGATLERTSRMDGLRDRAGSAIVRLNGSMEMADIEAVVLLERTLTEVASAYEATLATLTTAQQREEVDMRIEETVSGMVKAAEGRLATEDVVATSHLDTVLRHAQASSERLAGS